MSKIKNIVSKATSNFFKVDRGLYEVEKIVKEKSKFKKVYKSYKFIKKILK